MFYLFYGNRSEKKCGNLKKPKELFLMLDRISWKIHGSLMFLKVNLVNAPGFKLKRSNALPGGEK